MATIINTGGLLLEKYRVRDIKATDLASERRVCPLIGDKLREIKLLGKGKYGEVYEIDFEGRGSKRYAMKKSALPTTWRKVGLKDQSIPYENLRAYFSGLSDLPLETIMKFNGIEASPSESINAPTLTLIIPDFMSFACYDKNQYARFDGNGDTIVSSVPTSSKDSVVVNSSVPTSSKDSNSSVVCASFYTEFLISLLVAEYYRNGTSINFIDTIAFGICPGSKIDEQTTKPVADTKQYTIMEFVDGTLLSTINQDSEIVYGEKILNGMMVQIYHAIAVYQLNEIVHGDLHVENVFISKITDQTEWNGIKLKDVKFFCYRVAGVSLYVPNDGYIVKIGDWGLSCKYSDPKILNIDVMANGYAQKGGGPLVPNFYSAAYDPLFITNLVSHFHPNSFVNSILAWMFKTTDLKEGRRKVYDTSRPDMYALTEHLSHVSAAAILTNATLMGRFMEAPDMDVVTIGTI